MTNESQEYLISRDIILRVLTLDYILIVLKEYMTKVSTALTEFDTY